MEIIGAFIYANLEYVVASVGGIGFVAYMLTRKTYDHSNDLTTFVIKQNQQKDAISKRTK